ncbi:MAG: hypothetical protein HDR16_07630 [Lachnospiraceae bacterium]|nr:hypothetical protein [Lachnospiraceae bacterium]
MKIIENMKKNKRLLIYSFVWGIPVAASFVMGLRLVMQRMVFEGDGTLGFHVKNLLLLLVEILCFSVPAAGCAGFVLSRGEDRPKEQERQAEEKERQEETQLEWKVRPLWQVWLFYLAVIFACWLPVFLAYYPSVFAYDAEGQLYQVIAGDYSTHHPLLHTLFLGAFFRLGGRLGSYSAGMAVHSVVQMLLMAGAFAGALTYLYEKRTARWARILLLLFYGLFPTNSVLAISTTKDVLFSALVLLYTVWFYHLTCDRNMQVVWKERAVCILLGVLMLLFRNNAVYAFVVSVPVLFWGMRRIKNDQTSQPGNILWDGKAAGKEYLRLSLGILLLFAVSAVSLKALTHAQSGSPREMLSVPLQQMARVWVHEENGELMEDQSLRQEMEKYMPSEWGFSLYDPHLADRVKNIAIIHDDPKGLIKTWIRLGMEYPGIYIDAFLDNSVGLWFLPDDTHARVYGIGTETGFGYLSTDNRTMPAGCEIVEHSYLPGLRALMEKIVSDNEYENWPVVKFLFAPALYWWLLYLYVVVVLYKKRYREALPAVFLVVYYLTLLLSPTVLIRYMYPLVVTVPVILSCLTSGKKEENVKIDNKI